MIEIILLTRLNQNATKPNSNKLFLKKKFPNCIILFK